MPRSPRRPRKGTSARPSQKRAKAIKRLGLSGLHMGGNKPEWMILKVIPVMPLDLRQSMVQLDTAALYDLEPE